MHMIETPKVVEAPAQLVATLHIETPRSRMQQVMGPAIGEAMAAVKAQGIGPTGPWYAHHLKMTSETFDFDICVPVSAPVAAVGRVKPGRSPALKVVRTVYHGPYEGLGSAWHELGGWTEANGYKTAADLYECYVVGPESSPDPANWRTELSRPVIG
jgi:effector-binding domain-containing protein